MSFYLKIVCYRKCSVLITLQKYVHGVFGIPGKFHQNRNPGTWKLSYFYIGTPGFKTWYGFWQGEVLFPIVTEIPNKKDNDASRINDWSVWKRFK